MKQTTESIINAWTAFKPDSENIGMLYQAPEPKTGDRITAKTVIPVVEAYYKKFGTYPEMVLVCKDDCDKLMTALKDFDNVKDLDNYPDIGFAHFLSPNYGYIFLKHSEEIAKQQLQGNGD